MTFSPARSAAPSRSSAPAALPPRRASLPALAAAALAAAALLAVPSPAAAAELRDWSGLVEEVGPAVVQITAEVQEEGQDDEELRRGMRRFFRDHGFAFPFGDEFRMPFEEGGPFPDDNPFDDPARRSSSSGSGFIIRLGDGAYRVVTNNHVVSGADLLTVRFSDERSFTAVPVGADPETDLALLRLADLPEEAELPHVRFGDSSVVRVGSPVLAVGNPFGLGGTVTAGIVSAQGRQLGSRAFVDFFQTDAAINPGNSGGPLFNPEGEVVGVNTAIFTRSGAWAGIGFAIPSEVARNIIAMLESDGSVERGFLGVRFQKVTPELARGLGLAAAEGALVSEVLPGTPAEEAGLEVGDVILRVGDAPIREHGDLAPAVAVLAPGEEAELELRRKGEVVRASLTLALRPSADGEARTAREPARRGERLENSGLRVAPLDEKLRSILRLEPSVAGLAVLQVRPGSPAARAGLQPRDVVLLVNGETAEDPQILAAALEEDSDRPAVLQVRRGASLFFAALDAPHGGKGGKGGKDGKGSE